MNLKVDIYMRGTYPHTGKDFTEIRHTTITEDDLTELIRQREEEEDDYKHRKVNYINITSIEQ